MIERMEARKEFYQKTLDRLRELDIEVDTHDIEFLKWLRSLTQKAIVNILIVLSSEAVNKVLSFSCTIDLIKSLWLVSKQ